MSTSGMQTSDQQTEKNMVVEMRNANLLKNASVHNHRIEPLIVVEIAEATIDIPMVVNA
jgi:hypothetical protein